MASSSTFTLFPQEILFHACCANAEKSHVTVGQEFFKELIKDIPKNIACI
ncbi:MAG: hypothetical protein H0X29_07920 [Parachlamydiaceae bacterium]|nr:hypothetical protein [Parachlamydiaceae bacterium]